MSLAGKLELLLHFGRIAIPLAATVSGPPQNHWSFRPGGKGSSLQPAAKPCENASLRSVLPSIAPIWQTVGDASRWRRRRRHRKVPSSGGAPHSDVGAYVSGMQRQTSLPAHQLRLASWRKEVVGWQCILIQFYCSAISDHQCHQPSIPTRIFLLSFDWLILSSSSSLL